VFLIQLCYYFIPLFLIFSGIAFSIGGAYLYDLERGDEFIAMIVIGVVFITVGALLLIVAMVLYPMALANYVKGEERFGEAFRLFDITSKIFRVFGDYFLAYVIVFCVVFFISFLTILPIIGLLFSLLHLVLVFYLYYLVWFGLVGQACSGAFSDDAGFAPAVPER
jgi:hypothetical protein